MKIKYKELWKPYSTNGCTVEGLIAWARKQSDAPDEIMSTAIKNLFAELALGNKFSTKGCDCGCEMTNVHSAISHYFLKEVRKLNEQMSQRYWQLLENMQNASIKKLVKLELKKQSKPWYKRIF